ncbi:Peptidogalycan biosysnthesis/recognition [Chryseobacterium soldanellicola]|uniref:Peptidogalycan biosysnthesis/recognition n=1 Tax=Chryseobacterium soldanellicola TaxID=311333 RepID=A0A1H1DQ08_9FLAO|nr:peptidogalycan biosysnthesis protein [Chryseobacterium soldanellicola]SDQ78517.1 Peptidogalycan biosysnthesis/recognition [Chryseobacterium soldanellicola]
MSHTFKIYKTSDGLPAGWNEVIGKHNIMLSKEYFCVLEKSKPNNMECYFAGFFQHDQLIGGALFQYLNFKHHSTFQKGRVWCGIRNFLARTFSKDVMILGNNMLTGQNGFYFDPSKVNPEQVVLILHEAVKEIQKKLRKTSLIIYKDYQIGFIKFFQQKNHQSYYQFSVQPNMMLGIRENWKSFEDYLQDFSTKYRTRALSARKKFTGIEKRELDLNSVKKYQDEMNLLYQNVAENAPFNTFFLTENHFESLKENLNQNFKVFGYFLDEKLIGFYTLIVNNEDIDTYFLGYDKSLQKEKQLYLNMLLDMVEFGINHQFRRIIFGRTALEIKSTIGAEPVEIFGLIKHNNTLLNQFINQIFLSLTPKTEWVQRRPFK